MCIGADHNSLPMWRIKIIELICQCSGYMTLLCAGIIVTRKQVDIDYSRYLGPNTTKTYEGAGMIIQNHTSPLDVIISWLATTPHVGALGKREVLKIPLCKYLVGPLEFMLVGRDKKDSPEVRAQLISDIKER